MIDGRCNGKAGEAEHKQENQTRVAILRSADPPDKIDEEEGIRRTDEHVIGRRAAELQPSVVAGGGKEGCKMPVPRRRENIAKLDSFRTQCESAKRFRIARVDFRWLVIWSRHLLLYRANGDVFLLQRTVCEGIKKKSRHDQGYSHNTDDRQL